MGTEHIGRLARWSLGVGLIGCLVPLGLRAMTWSTGIGVGTLWGIANLLLLRFIVVRWIRPQEAKRREPRAIELAIGLVLKFPILYGIGYLLLRSDWFRIEALVIGFIVPFGVAFADAVLRVIGERRTGGAPAPTGVAPAGTNVESGS